jgi:probable rRNA maturation factor
MSQGFGDNTPVDEAGQGPPRDRLTLELLDATREVPREDLAWLGDHISRSCRELRAVGSLRVRIIGDAEMADAHLEFSGVAGTTDVLTFDLGCEALDPERPLAGVVLDTDVLVCWDEAGRQAAARGHEPRRELLLYVVHGVLHCMGHDDHDAEGYARMHAEEDRVLGSIGVGPIFGAGGGGS